MKIIKTVNEVSLDLISEDNTGTLAFLISPKGVTIQPLSKTIIVAVDTFILTSKIEIKPLYNEDGTAQTQEDGFHDYEEKEIDILTPIDLKTSLVGEYSDTEVQEMVDLLVAEGTIDADDSVMTKITTAIQHGIKVKLVASDKIKFTDSDLIEHELRTL